MTTFNAERFAQFSEVYTRNLRKAVEQYPNEYAWPIELTDEVAHRMLEAVKRGSFSKDGRAFRLTCKELGIKQTYTAINAFLDRRED